MTRTKKDDAHYKLTRVNGYADMIRKALEKKNRYDESLELTIHMLACCLSRYAQIQSALDKETELVCVSTSREGNDRYSVHPLFVMQEHMGEQIRKYLRELKLTLTLGASGDNEEEDTGEFNKLFDVINGNSNKGPRLLRPVKSGTK